MGHYWAEKHVLEMDKKTRGLEIAGTTQENVDSYLRYHSLGLIGKAATGKIREQTQ